AGVIQRPAASAVVTERLGLREWRKGPVVHAAVDGKNLGGAPTEIAGASGGRRATGRSRRSPVPGCALKHGGWGACASRRSADGWTYDLLRGRRSRHRGSGDSLDLVEGEQFQIPFRAERGCYFLFDRGKAKHLDLHRPDAVRQVGKGVGALQVADGD